MRILRGQSAFSVSLQIYWINAIVFILFRYAAVMVLAVGNSKCLCCLEKHHHNLTPWLGQAVSYYETDTCYCPCKCHYEDWWNVFWTLTHASILILYIYICVCVCVRVPIPCMPQPCCDLWICDIVPAVKLASSRVRIFLWAHIPLLLASNAFFRDAECNAATLMSHGWCPNW